MPEKCPYSEFFRSVFSRIWTEYGSEKLRMRALFMQYWELVYKNFGAPSTGDLNNIPTNSSDWYFMKTFFLYVDVFASK